MSWPLLAQVKLKEKLRSQHRGGGLIAATNPPGVTDLGVYTDGPSLSRRCQPLEWPAALSPWPGFRPSLADL